ncbi:MAG: TetR/AcrR family transcriptional regulator [Bacteroidota bacterium]|nr:TetR/AcrR family transcriptional regulator [Bacteroidota bacterium]
MPENQEISQDLKKNQILAAAKQVFGRFGFAKTTLDDVANAVGMKKASLYYYYESKEELFKDVVKSETDELIKELENKVFTTNDVHDQLTTYIKTRLAYLQKMINIHNLTVNSILEFKPISELLYREFFEKQILIVVKIFSDGLQRGELKKVDTHRAANIFVSAIESIATKVLCKSKATNEINYKSIEDDSLFLTELIINGLKK